MKSRLSAALAVAAAIMLAPAAGRADSVFSQGTSTPLGSSSPFPAAVFPNPSSLPLQSSINNQFTILRFGSLGLPPVVP